MKRIIFLGMMILALTTSAYAIPALQLGINGGTYDSVTDTTVASGNFFDLYAYLLPNASNTISDTYYLSAALVKPSYANVPNSALTLGSFTIDGTPYNVSGDMTYGTPPLDALYTPNLGGHDIFETFYLEKSFSFLASDLINPAVNVEDGSTQNTDMYRHKFSIDLSGMTDQYGIHFDLYNLLVTTNEHNGNIKYDISEAAPFSHDAEGWKTSTPVPEPGTMMILGAGFLGLAVYSKRRKNA